MNKRIAVLMTVHNRKKKTLDCLSKLYGQDNFGDFSFDVYLTDDGCTDGTSTAISEQYPDVNIIKGDGNLYWNRGMWTAWSEAAKGDYEYYLWLNDDTNLYPYAINELLSVAGKYGSRCIVVGACQSSDRIKMTYGGRNENGLIQPDGEVKEVSIVNGNILLVPRYVFKVLGNLNFRFHHGGGDFDYSWRASQKGIKCFQASTYLGECDEHDRLSDWCNPEVPLMKRMKLLYKPNGMPPSILFYQQRREKGLLPACFHYLTVHLRCILPQIWVFLGKN